MSEPAVRTLGAVLYPQFELLDLYGPLEMFGALEKEIRIVTVAESKGPVASTPGRRDGRAPRLRATARGST